MTEIFPMKSEHIEQVYSIETATFPIPWSRREFEKELNNDMAVYFIACKQSEVVGYAGMWHIVNEGHIVNIAVRGNERRRGIGSLLVRRLIDCAREREMIGLTLEVRISNLAAQRLYHSFGFKPEGLRGRYYENSEDAIIMWMYF
ncbi:MAG: ribosomal protein S18-alanine N-acetyltransferase [Clostridiales bacterium]|jgi:ribosomal-protein-alanine N-acetyltransferase|nr:ribosomal protein S18-alanine N-acetyltransferase [Clostridiales bacterium]